MARVLVADDDRSIRRNLIKLLQAEGYETIEAATGVETVERIRADSPDAVLLDLKMPDRGGLEVLADLGAALEDLPVVVLTGAGGSTAAIEAMRRGAYDYLNKPFDLDEVLFTLKRALHQRTLTAQVKALRNSSSNDDESEESGSPSQESTEPELIGTGPSMREVFKTTGRAAATEEPVLIIGESGTGKELIAEAVHRHSRRAGGPLIRVNCGALPESLIESELFGHEKGSFTGADKQRAGRFERAAGGTIFLDEVGEIPLSAQAKLLRVLQSREFERVGGNQTLRADARIVSATHRDLAKEVAEGRFREDLYYRLNVVRITIPPLRDRREDIPSLVDAILRRLERKYGWPGLSLAPDAFEVVADWDWPGNVRQLENSLARAAITARGKAILPEHLETELTSSASEGGSAEYAAISAVAVAAQTESLPLRAILAEVERKTIQQALDACNGNRTRAAEQLGISRRQLFDKVREYDLRV